MTTSPTPKLLPRNVAALRAGQIPEPNETVRTVVGNSVSTRLEFRDRQFLSWSRMRPSQSRTPVFSVSRSRCAKRRRTGISQSLHRCRRCGRGGGRRRARRHFRRGPRELSNSSNAICRGGAPPVDRNYNWRFRSIGRIDGDIERTGRQEFWRWTPPAGRLDSDPPPEGRRRRHIETDAPAGLRLQFRITLTAPRARYLDDNGALARMFVPGELTQSLCSPWTHDFRDCACFYLGFEPSRHCSAAAARSICLDQRYALGAGHGLGARRPLDAIAAGQRRPRATQRKWRITKSVATGSC